MPTLCDWPAKHVEIRCTPCGRAGRYDLARLIQRHGLHASTHGLYLRLIATFRTEGRCEAVMDVPAGTRVPSKPRSRT